MQRHNFVWMLCLAGGLSCAVAAAGPGPIPPAPQQERARLQAEVQQFYQNGKLAEAAAALEKLLVVERTLFGAKHEALVGTLTMLAQVQEQRRDIPAARQALEQALAVRVQLYGKDDWRVRDGRQALNLLAARAALKPEQQQHFARVLAAHGQALQLRQQGQESKAVPLLEQACTGYKHIFGADSLYCISATEQLARVQRDLGRYDESLRLYQQACTLRKNLLGEKHPAYAASLNDLAMLHQDLGHFQEALPLYQRSAQLRRELLGEQHPDYAQSLNNLGSQYQDLGEYDQALKHFQKALELRKELPGEQHPDYGQSVNNLAVLYQDMGELQKALPLLEQARDLAQKLRGDQSTDYARSLNNLASLYQDMGLYARALPLYEQARTIYRQTVGEHHPLYAFCLNNLASLYHQRGEFAKALPLYEQAWQLRKQALGESHPYTVVTQNNLALLQQDMGQTAQAIAHLEQVRRLKSFDKAHPVYAANLNNLGRLYQDRGDYAKALPLFQEALALRKQHLGTKHPDYPRSLDSLARLYHDQGNYDTALPLYEQACALRRELHGPDHPLYADSLYRLGLLHHDQQQFAQARDCYEKSLAIYQKLIDVVAASSSETEALNFVASLPGAYQGLLSASRHLPASAADIYTRTWHTKAAVTRILQRRQQALATAANPRVRPLWDELQSKRRQLARTLLRSAGGKPEQRAYLERLTEEKEQLERQLARLLPDFEPTQSPTDLLQAMPRGTAFVDFVPYVDLQHDPKKPGKAGRTSTLHYVAFVLADKHIQRVELGAAAAMDEALASWRRQLGAATFTRGWTNPALSIGTLVLQAARPGPPALPALLLSFDGTRGFWADPGPEETGQPAVQLRERLWVPLTKYLPAGTQTVYIAPTMNLTRLPWAALPGDRAGTVLLEQYALATVPHAPFLLDQLTQARREDKGTPHPQPLSPVLRGEGSRKVPRSGTPERGAEDGSPRPGTPGRGAGGEGFGSGQLLAVGGVSYGAAPDSLKKPAAIDLALRAPAERSGGVHWPALPGTVRELDRILALAESRPVLSRQGTAASTAQILADLPKATWVHLATHGFFASPHFRSVLQLDEAVFEQRGRDERAQPGTRNPLVLSGLVLAGANLPPRDAEDDGGILTAEAIASLPLNQLQLAVLSACETGLGEVAGGEGVFGLQRAFHLAGADNVLASLWQVNDEATAALMSLFYYKMWQQHQPPLQALREAQLFLYHHPDQIRSLAQADSTDFPRLLHSAPASSHTAPAHLWAAFVLSGAGK